MHTLTYVILLLPFPGVYGARRPRHEAADGTPHPEHCPRQSRGSRGSAPLSRRVISPSSRRRPCGAQRHGFWSAIRRFYARVQTAQMAGRWFRCILFKTHLLGWDWYDMPVYRMAITSTQKHQCPSKCTPWALCTQPRSAVWGYFTPVLLIIHTSGPPYFHIYISVTDWSRFQCHISTLGVDLWVL